MHGAAEVSGRRASLSERARPQHHQLPRAAACACNCSINQMFKKYLSAGLLLWVPLVITFWVLETIIRWSDALVAMLPPEVQPVNLLGFNFPGIGIVIALAAVFATGILVANFVGQWIVGRWESLLARIPLVRPIYSGVKQIASTVLSDQTKSFKEVVLVEFPQKGQWTIGLIVSTPSDTIKNELGISDLLTVYVPTAPNPTSGYVIFASEKDVVKSSISVDEAFKFHLSLGVMSPGERR